jgi:hypothetical protein
VKQFTGLFHLSTPLRSDAVTFCFGVMACPGTDFHHAVYAPSRAHDSRLRGNDGGVKQSGCPFVSFVFDGEAGQRNDGRLGKKREKNEGAKGSDTFVCVQMLEC